MSAGQRVIRDNPPPKQGRKRREVDERRSGRYLTYRGYHLERQRGGAWRATFRFAPMFPRMPRSFIWTRFGDLPGLYSYVDAWYSGLEERTAALERDGSVTSTVYGGDVDAITTVRVNIKQFVEALKMAKCFVIPAWTKLEFVTDSTGRLVPADFIACLKDLAPEQFADYPAEGWRRAVDRDLPDITAQVQTEAAETVAAAGGADTADDEPPRETVIERFTDSDALHITTRTVRAGMHPYFTKRVIARGRTIYSATAWNRSGPWKVWTRDTSALLARGIDL